MERSHIFDKIIGTNEEKVNFENAVSKDPLEKKIDIEPEYEVLWGEKEVEIFNIVQKHIGQLLKSYGCRQKEIPRNNVHLVKPGIQIPKMKNRSFASLDIQGAVVERKQTDIIFAAILAHELLHLNSYNIIYIGKKGARPLQQGMNLHWEEREIVFFSDLEEAIIATLTSRIVNEKFLKENLFEDEVEDLKLVRKWIGKYFKLGRAGFSKLDKKIFIDGVYVMLDVFVNDIQLMEVLKSDKSDDYKMDFFIKRTDVFVDKGQMSSERMFERSKFNKLINKIVKHSKGKYGREDIFSLFVRADFNNERAALVKVIEETLGKGSFSQIAKDFLEVKE